MIKPILDKNTTKTTVKKPACFLTAVSSDQLKYAITFWKTLTKFHSPKEIDMLCYTNEKDPEKLKALPEGIKVVDLTSYLDDQMFWFRQKPILMEPLLDKYELVVGFDSDQIVLGDLNAILESNDYDAGVVINWNRFDEKFYPIVEIMRLGIQPVQYYNCGLVALRSKQFAHTWLVNCFTQEYNFMQYKEQDILNVLTHFGNWNVRCFDMPNGPDSPTSFYGIVGKGEWAQSEIEGDKVMVRKGEGPQAFPPSDVQIRIAHMGGGNGAPKDNWNQFFPPTVMERIQELIK